MYERQITLEIQELATGYPVVTVIGPRQSGKTTLVKNVFSKKAYVNLEDPDTRAFAEADPRSFLEKYPEGAILDEIQRVPLLLSYSHLKFILHSGLRQSVKNPLSQSGLY